MEEILSKILGYIMEAKEASITIALVIDFALRLIPSKKPLSIAHGIAGIAKLIGQILVKFAELLDAVLPQKKKEEPQIELK